MAIGQRVSCLQMKSHGKLDQSKITGEMEFIGKWTKGNKNCLNYDLVQMHAWTPSHFASIVKILII